MRRVAGQGRAQHAAYLRPLKQPVGDLQGAAGVLRHAQRQRAHATQHQEGVVGADRLAKVDGGALQGPPGALVGYDRAHHDVGMAAQIFGGRQDGDIGAEREGFVHQTGRPGVIHSQPAIVFSRSCG
ncbi:hypothetical protein D3C72_1375740 [compost metagenome]